MIARPAVAPTDCREMWRSVSPADFSGEAIRFYPDGSTIPVRAAFRDRDGATSGSAPGPFNRWNQEAR